jgi:hypothetical protein
MVVDAFWHHLLNQTKPIFMKFTTTLVVLFSLFTVTGFSQATKTIHPPSATPLFASYPGSIKCKEAELNDIFKSLSGQNINVLLSGTPMFSGVVVSNIAKHSNLQYIAIKLPGLNNATLSLTKRIDEKNNTVYIGHIINPKNSDAYELKHLADGSYQFIKTDLEKVLPTCSMQ